MEKQLKTKFPSWHGMLEKQFKDAKRVIPFSPMKTKYKFRDNKMKKNINIELPHWSAKFFKHAPYKTIYGGRCSLKNSTVTKLLILKAISKKRRILVYQNSRFDNYIHNFLITIENLGLKDNFKSIDRHIINAVNGSDIIFGNFPNNHALENITDIYVPDAQNISTETERNLSCILHRESYTLHRGIMKFLNPLQSLYFKLKSLIMKKKPDKEFWIVANPNKKTDWFYKRFIQEPISTDMIEMVNWDHPDNKPLPHNINEERLFDLKNLSESEYRLIWHGEIPDDELKNSA